MATMMQPFETVWVEYDDDDNDDDDDDGIVFDMGGVMEVGGSEEENEDEEEYDAENEEDEDDNLSILHRHVYKNGRRYQCFQEDAYPLPNDELEQRREALVYELIREVMDGKLYLAPIGRNPRKILDLGTGIGHWAVDMADRFPKAAVLGMDYSAIQPILVPPNVVFEIGEIEEDWMLEINYDFIHMRDVMQFLNDPAKTFERAFYHLKPGGWFETQSFGTLSVYEEDEDETTMLEKDNTTLWPWCQIQSEEVLNFDPQLKTRPQLLAAGFTNIQHHVYRIPCGLWPASSSRPEQRRLGEMAVTALLSLSSALANSLKSTTMMMPREVDTSLCQMREMLTTLSEYGGTRWCWGFHVWWAQKKEACADTVE